MSDQKTYVCLHRFLGMAIDCSCKQEAPLKQRIWKQFLKLVQWRRNA